MEDSKKENRAGKKPSVEVLKNGPYKVKDLKKFENSKGEDIETQPSMLLCRCGQSSNKPFCNGTHARVGFSGNKLEGRGADRMDDYEGKEITIHDNRGVCAHRGHCTDNLPNVFSMKQKPWIDPDTEKPDEIARVIEMCPSGALSYTKDGVLHKDLDRESKIIVSKDGPLDVVGGVDFKDPEGNTTESKEHYTLCRCGGSKNKPFCDGTHWSIAFKDDKN
jgi:CDGSH-type Zn-finger protein